MERKNVVGALLIILSISIVIYAAQPYFPELQPPGDIPGDQPQTLLQTEIVVKHGLFGDPYIESVTTTQVVVSSQLYTPSGVEILLFPWEGVLKLEITAPNGHKITMSKAIKIETNEQKTFFFTWKTRQTGQHTLLATLMTKEGTTINQKQEVVYV